MYIYIHILYITCSNQLKPFQLGISGTPRTEFPALPATTDGSLGIPPSTAACFRMDASCDFPSLSNSTGILQVSPSSPSAAVKRPKGANSGEIDGNLLEGI